MAGNENSQIDLFGKIPDTIEQEIEKSRNLAGRYAEFIVCAQLTKLGHYVIHVDTEGFDLILQFDGASYRVNVKSTSQCYIGPFKRIVQWNAHRHRRRTDRANPGGPWRKPLTEKDADLLALFYNPTETTTFVPVIDPMTASPLRIPLLIARNPENIERSLIAAIAKKRGRI